METILYKYHSLENDYLVFDINRFKAHLDPRAVRTICSRNYGLSSAGIVAGPFIGRDGNMEMRAFAPDGEEMKMDREATDAGISYLEDAGYLKDHRKDVSAKAVGKVFLSEEFVNHYLGD